MSAHTSSRWYFCFTQLPVEFPVFPAPVRLLELPSPGLSVVIVFLLYTHVVDLQEMLEPDQSIALNWVEWSVDTFVRDVADGGIVVSPYFAKGPSPAEAEELAAYCYMKGIKLRIKYDGTGSYCRRTTFVHEAPVNALSYMFGRENERRTGDSDLPFIVNYTTGRKVFGSLYQPNFQARVHLRQSVDSNFMVDIDYYPAAPTLQDVTNFNTRLRNFILASNGIMIGMGILIYSCDAQTQTFPALAIVYERQFVEDGGCGGLPVLTHLVSFGTAPLPDEAVAHWSVLTEGRPICGVGFDDVPCNAPNRASAPYVIKLPEELLLCRNISQPFEFGEAELEPRGHGVEIYLFDIQKRIARSLKDC
jgi:hypothetical protein